MNKFIGLCHYIRDEYPGCWYRATRLGSSSSRAARRAILRYFMDNIEWNA